jgi:hypothetical protein
MPCKNAEKMKSEPGMAKKWLKKHGTKASAKGSRYSEALKK